MRAKLHFEDDDVYIYIAALSILYIRNILGNEWIRSAFGQTRRNLMFNG